jgi:preprotein translocase subunit YajC
MTGGFLGQAGSAPAPGGVAALLGSPIFVLISFFLIMYFLLIRPRQKEQRKHDAMLNALQRGDRILTNGGIYGRIENVREKEGVLVVKVAEGVKVEVARSSVASVLDRGGKAEGSA